MTDTDTTQLTALPSRHEVPRALCWATEDIFASPADWAQALEALPGLVGDFATRFEGKIREATTSAELREALDAMEALRLKMMHVSYYAFLTQAVDYHDREAQARVQRLDQQFSALNAQLAFYDDELLQVALALLEELARDPQLTQLVARLEEQRAHRLSAETERVLAALAPILNYPEEGYQTTKMADMRFPDFEVDGEGYANSYVRFENDYQLRLDTGLRRAAFASFSEGLRPYRHTTAGYLVTQMQREGIEARLRGYDSTISMLLARQRVSRELYDRQIDGIMTHLAPIMRRYAALIGEALGLEEVRYSDLKVPLTALATGDEAMSIEEAQRQVTQALGLLGDEYQGLVERSFAERWTDFAANAGKSTGGFCASLYDVHPYILLSWSGQGAEVFTLAHELGHAVHAVLAAQANRLSATGLSMYLVEAPSTCNELLLGEWLMAQDPEDEATRSRVRAALVANTYYHNFVTHLLEAHWQRACYLALEAGETLTADDLDRIFRETLEAFWGDAVVLDEGAELTWMRQPHYYMGLYPYTYSAGLTLATSVAGRIRRGEAGAVEDWLTALRSGGTLTIEAFAARAGVDLSTDAALRETIDYIGSLVDGIDLEALRG